MQLPEDHGTPVPLLGLAQGMVQSGLEVSNIPNSLSTVDLCEVVLGFIEVFDCSLQS